MSLSKRSCWLSPVIFNQLASNLEGVASVLDADCGQGAQTIELGATPRVGHLMPPSMFLVRRRIRGYPC